MSLKKRCSRSGSRTLPSGTANPLWCRTSPRCAHFWHYDFRVNGRRYRASTETADKHTARDIEARERARILDGKHGIRRQKDVTVRELWALYLANYATPNHKPSTVHRERQMWRVLDRHLGGHLLHEITSFTLEQFKARRLAERVKPATMAREFMILSSMLRRAVEWGYLLASPAVGVKVPRDRARRTRILTPDESARLLEAYDHGRHAKVKPLIHLLLATAARFGELRVLRWRDCQQGYLWLYHTKNGRSRRLPITEDIAAILDAIPRLGEYVFVSWRTGQPFKCVLTGFRAALKVAGIGTEDVVIHTLRHTAISRMMDANIDPRTIMEISGHSSLSELERYTHPREQRKAEALRAINVSPMDTKRSQTPVLSFGKSKAVNS
jgi:integrase